MIDFTVKGTILPTVPKGTLRTTSKGSTWIGLGYTATNLICYYSTIINGETCIYAETSHYTGSNYFIFKLYDIERLAKEQSMILKGLPKYYVVQCDEKHPDWTKFIKHLNSFGSTWNGYRDGEFYGFDGNPKHKGTNVWPKVSQFENNPTVLTIEEFVSLTNQKSETMIKITREQLHSIHKIACVSWQTKIHRIAENFPFSNEIELKKEQVDEMFKAAEPHQLPTLEAIFGARPKEINLKSSTINAQVDGINIFGNSDADREKAFIGLPSVHATGTNVFYLNRSYKWTYDPATETLIVNRK